MGIFDTRAGDGRAARGAGVLSVRQYGDQCGDDGNALLIQFPDLRFERRLIPFISSVEEARRSIILDAAMHGPVTPLAFTTAAVDEIRQVLHSSRCPIIDFFGLHMDRVESILGAGRTSPRGCTGWATSAVQQRMAAVEFAIEHDDGQSLRALDKAEVILVAPSRCGKTPTTMYLALQHGVFVANYPLVDEDFESSELPRPVRPLRERCFGIVTTPQRLSQVRTERRAHSGYASLEQCTSRSGGRRPLSHPQIPTINSSA